MIEKEVIKLKLYDEIYDCYLNIGRYMNNNRLYLGLSTADSSFTDITINLPDCSLIDDSTIFVNGDLSNEIKNQLKQYGILSNFLYSVNYNMGNYDCYSVNLEKLNYYNKKEFEEAGLKLEKEKNKECNIGI